MLLLLSPFPPIFAVDSAAISYGSSKLFQILLPLGTYMLFREVPAVRNALWRLLSPVVAAESRDRFDYYFDLALGFASWKIGCDFGFLIVATGVAQWQRSFTLIGLIPYTIAQYLAYYWIGQKMIIQGQLNPFKEELTPPTVRGRPSWLRQLASRWLHESGNATSPNVPLRQVFLKPFIDYGGIVVSWSIYNSGLLWLQSGELSLEPMVHFMFLQIFAFYVVNVFGFIVGFNIGEWVYLWSIDFEELLERWLHSQTLVPANETNPFSKPLQATRSAWVRFKSTVAWRAEPFLQRYGLNLRWLICSGLGVAAIVLVEPYLAGPILNTSAGLHESYYQSFGEMDPVRVEQVTYATPAQGLPPSERLIDEFPVKWGFLYFLD